ncbi:MAG TPA: SDR family oxidoreductase [Terriglobia bacterium]|nr:SDR family oxidoreductase [Terriglobia bacterium]
MDESLRSVFDLSGRTAIVTGVSRGLGVSLARGLAKAGCDLVITARNLEELRRVAVDLDPFGHRVVPVRADVSKPDDVAALVSEAVAALGHIDVLVNNAGISTVADAENMTMEQWQSVIDTNLTGVFICAQAAGRQMLKQGHGKIINIASMYGISAASYVPQVSYVASKSGVLGLTRQLAVEWAPRGLQVVALVPGFFASEQTRWAFRPGNELGEKLLAKVPMGRMGKLEELEPTIVYLASPASDYMNGQAIILDGGFLAW